MKTVRVACAFMLLLVLTAGAEDSTANQYFFVLLRRPANPPQLSKEAGEQLQNEHMSNIRKMYNEGKLVMAGPFVDDTELRGIFVLRAASEQQAQDWADQDPAVKAGRLKAEVHGPWMIQADQIHKASETGMEQYFLVLVKRGAGENRSEIEELLSSGELALGGKIHDTRDLAAVTIYPAGSELAKKLTDAHHAVRSQAVQIEIHPWITAKGVLKPGQPFQM
jgi:uncharacterized protein YciI